MMIDAAAALLDELYLRNNGFVDERIGAEDFDELHVGDVERA